MTTSPLGGVGVKILYQKVCVGFEISKVHEDLPGRGVQERGGLEGSRDVQIPFFPSR